MLAKRACSHCKGRQASSTAIKIGLVHGREIAQSPNRQVEVGAHIGGTAGLIEQFKRSFH